MKLILISLIFTFNLQANLNLGKDFSFTKVSSDDIQSSLTEEVLSQNKFIKSLDIAGVNYSIDYSINEAFNKKISRIIRSYRSDFTAVAVIDNNTGAVIALTDYTKKGDSYGINLALSNTHPAASVFKMITAADLLENKKLDVDGNSKFSYHGRGVTLYKKQLKKEKSRWSRSIQFKKAFAYSNNVVFGKAAIYNSTFSSIEKTSSKFGFDETVVQFIDVPQSHILKAGNQYQLAELASGFNKVTSISPLHAAAMSSIIVNDGIEKKPYIVSSIKDTRIDKDVWRSHYDLERVLSKDTSRSLREMMRLTVNRGTARGTFLKRKLNKKLRSLEIGGKTGTITGGLPYGKRDWFVSYAKPKEDQSDLGISVAVMIINQKKWPQEAFLAVLKVE